MGDKRWLSFAVLRGTSSDLPRTSREVFGGMLFKKRGVGLKRKQKEKWPEKSKNRNLMPENSVKSQGVQKIKRNSDLLTKFAGSLIFHLLPPKNPQPVPRLICRFPAQAPLFVVVVVFWAGGTTVPVPTKPSSALFAVRRSLAQTLCWP